MGDVEQKIYDNYINISSPSIVYPYIRAFITNLVIQTGMKPIIIPPLNFANKPSAPEVKDNL
jgi:preprotein translocase subunit SecB